MEDLEDLTGLGDSEVMMEKTKVLARRKLITISIMNSLESRSLLPPNKSEKLSGEKH